MLLDWLTDKSKWILKKAEAVLEMLHLNRKFNFLQSKQKPVTSILHDCTTENTQQARRNATFYFANFDMQIDMRFVICALALKTNIFVQWSLDKQLDIAFLKQFLYSLLLFPATGIKYNTRNI